MKKIQLYTDGSCSKNPGPGGWGAILRYKDTERELSGGEIDTTNNRMELTAAIQGLSALKQPCEVDLYTDSQYLSRAFSEGWLDSWRQKGYMKKGEEIPNADLWRQLFDLSKRHKLRLFWVKGHAENEFNNRCDALATAQTEIFKNQL